VLAAMAVLEVGGVVLVPLGIGLLEGVAPAPAKRGAEMQIRRGLGAAESIAEGAAESIPDAPRNGGQEP